MDIDALIRMRLLTEDQRQDVEALQTAVAWRALVRVTYSDERSLRFDQAIMIAYLMLADFRLSHHALARQFDGISLR